jgi:feruloyl esterase
MVAGCNGDSASKFADAEACLSLAERDFGFSKVRAAWIEGNFTQDLPAFARLGLPAYCLVDAEIRPVPGSRIRVVYRLPENWNGKVYGLGGGGWAGNTFEYWAGDALGQGFATLQTDAGHTGGDTSSLYAWDNSWMGANPQAAKDFSYRAVHEMTVAGKEVVAAYYGRKPDSAHFVGCSTGGRMALMEAQRYPADYDVIVAGSPVYTLQTQTTGLMAMNLFAAPGAGFDEEDLRLATDSAVAACDANDGLEDGLINDPRACRWDPAAIQCPGARTAGCLSPPQVAALQTLYDGIKSPDGQWALWPTSRGGETALDDFLYTRPTPAELILAQERTFSHLKSLLIPDRDVDWARFSAVADAPQVRQSAFAQMYEAKDPDLSRFFARGGKLLLWGGENDIAPAPHGVIDYAREVIAADPRAARQFRAFLVPGVGHCGGQYDRPPLGETIDAWTQTGKPPDTLLATMHEGSMTRLVCAWPKVARYSGNGDPGVSSSWRCVAPRS